jgi:hypothetical protein
MLRLGVDQTSNASRHVKRGCDPFVDGRDRFVRFMHGLGGPCYGWYKPKTFQLHRVMECIQAIYFTREPASACGWVDLNQPARMLRLGFDQTSNASRHVKRGCDPFVNMDVIDSSGTRTASEGHATVGTNQRHSNSIVLWNVSRRFTLRVSQPALAVGSI